MLLGFFFCKFSNLRWLTAFLMSNRVGMSLARAIGARTWEGPETLLLRWDELLNLCALSHKTTLWLNVWYPVTQLFWHSHFRSCKEEFPSRYCGRTALTFRCGGRGMCTHVYVNWNGQFLFLCFCSCHKLICRTDNCGSFCLTPLIPWGPD